MEKKNVMYRLQTVHRHHHHHHYHHHHKLCMVRSLGPIPVNPKMVLVSLSSFWSPYVSSPPSSVTDCKMWRVLLPTLSSCFYFSLFFVSSYLFNYICHFRSSSDVRISFVVKHNSGLGNSYILPVAFAIPFCLKSIFHCHYCPRVDVRWTQLCMN
jgi:hypothetical protein